MRLPDRRTIILFHPRTRHERNYRYFHVPYSVLSVASALDRSRYQVIVIDNNPFGSEETPGLEGVENLDEFGPILRGVAGDLLFVGISSMIGHQIRDGLRFAQAVRDLDASIPLVWGGALPTVLPQATIEHPNVDIIVRGQGQATFRHLVDCLTLGQDLAQVPGISYKPAQIAPHPTGRGASRCAQITHNAPMVFADLNRFPPFSSVYDLIDPAAYVRFDEHINSRTISYHAGQGCPFNCGFCSEVALWQNRWSGFHAERILDDIAYLVEHFGVNGIKFYDAEFFIDRRRALRFAQGAIERGLSIRWAAAIHPRNLDRLMDEQLDLLRRSGAARLLIGAESGVQEELDLVGKHTNREMILRLARRCSRHDIVASFTFVTGYPGRPSANIDATLRFASELMAIDPRHEAKVHFYAPYPGTPLYGLALAHGFVPPQTLEEWSWYDYYNIVTPWVDRSYEPIIRQFNEAHYPYLHPIPNLKPALTLVEVSQIPNPRTALAGLRPRRSPNPKPVLSEAEGSQIPNLKSQIPNLKSRTPQLRISVTFPCGKACIYCRPGGEGLRPTRRREMTLEEIVHLVELLARHGITDVKLTGGDPMLREDIVEIVAGLKQVPGIRSVHLLTRHPRAGDCAGVFQKAGLDCLNFSLDSLDGTTWSRITRVGGHAALMAAIRKAAATRITLKINTVVLRGINDHEIPGLVEFAGDIGATLKLLDLIADLPAFPGIEPDFGRRRYFDLNQILPMLAAGAVEMDVVYQPGGLGHPMPRFVMQNGATVLVKSSRMGAWYGDVCQTCPLFPCHDAIMALRLTADGKLQRCLLREDNLVDLLGLTRSDASMDQIDATLEQVLHTYRYAAFYPQTPVVTTSVVPQAPVVTTSVVPKTPVVTTSVVPEAAQGATTTSFRIGSGSAKAEGAFYSASRRGDCLK